MPPKEIIKPVSSWVCRGGIAHDPDLKVVQWRQSLILADYAQCRWHAASGKPGDSQTSLHHSDQSKEART